MLVTPFAVTLQSVSIWQVNRNIMSQFTQTSNRFVVVYAVKISNVSKLFHVTLKDAGRQEIGTFGIKLSVWQVGTREFANKEEEILLIKL